MNLKRFMSRFLALFASLFVAVVLATESFAVMYLPGQVIEKFNYTSNVTFTAQYTAVVCDAGMYLPEGGAECVACPAGYYCLAGGAPVACPAGHYCLSGTQSANGSGQVAAGYYSTGGAKVQNPQSAEDCVGDDNVCGLIDAGYWGAAGATISTGSGKVAAGYWNNGGGTSATPTAAGNGCLANKSCGTCANWTYSGEGATSCVACPAVESGYEKLDSTSVGWTTYQKCVEIATASPENCASGKLQKIPTESGATTWAAATVNANNPLVAKPGYIVSGTACLSEGYTVSFEVNGGNDVSDITCTVETADITLPTPTKTGYTFGGWYQNSDFSGDAISVIAKGTCTSAYKLYAKWTAIERKITLNANGGAIVGGSSVTPSACTVETADITLPTPTRTGYTFGGWYQNSDFSGYAISVIAKGDCLSDYTLYAKWTANTYIVTLDTNGGVGGTSAVTATYGMLLPEAIMPTKANFVFKGYYSAQTGGVQYYNMLGEPATWDIDSDLTLFAQWMANGVCEPGFYYNVTTGTVEQCPEDSYCTGGEWNTDSGVVCPVVKCPSDYPNSVAGASNEGQCYLKSPSSCRCLNDEVTCKEVKGANSCVYTPHYFEGVKYKGTDICVPAPGSTDKTYCAIKSVSCKSNSYYTVKGDIENGVCAPCSSLGGGYEKSNSWTVYPPKSDVGDMACYRIENLYCTAPVCPLAGIGTCTYDASSYEYGGGFLFYGMSVPLPGTKKNYVCPDASFTCNAGYDKNEDADIDPTDGSASAPEELCTPHVYTFTLDPNGGETAIGMIYEKYSTGWYSDQAATARITKVAVPVRHGYTFAGYYTKATALEGGVPVIDAAGRILDEPDVAADTVLYAWWQVNTYTVKYNAAGASGTMDSVTHTCDEPLNLTPNAFTSATNDRQFIGWATEPNATTPEYTDGQKVVNLTLVNNAVVTLYPVWKACTACAAGNDATCSLTAPVGVCTYTTACAANYENLQNAGKYNPTCSAIKYALNMETNGGVIADDYDQISQCTVESGTIVLPTAAQISREDYRFEGWYDNVATTGSAISSIPAGECTASKTLYAKWVINVEMCQPGMYYNGTSFVTCPKGYYCPGEGKVVIGVTGCRTACPNGYDDGVAGISDESQCQISVPQGSYLATAKGAEMTLCPAGKYTASAVLVSYGDTSECSSCEAGNYCDGGVKYSCATETDGVFANSAVGSANIDACYTTTVAGKYIVDNAIKTCAVPYYCPGGVKVLYGNSGGNLSCADLSDEVEWKSGITSSGASAPDMCYVQVQAGRYWNGSEFAECKVGTYKVEHTVYYNQTSSCTTCPAGYTSEAGASECYLITTAGKYVATAGQGEVECKVGDFCPGGVKVMVSGVGGNTACATLAGGKYSMSVAGTKSADMCYSENCALSTNATQMTGKDYYGASVADTCEAVQCETGFVLANGACGSCPANSVCDPNYDGGKPHTCSELTNGKYILSLENTSSIDACYTITTPGKYVAVAGQGEVTCKVGDYCLGGAKVMYTATGGNSACSTFGAGYSSDVGASEETQCYQRCALAANATQMSGRDYYGTDATDTCMVASCEAGYTVAGGVCAVCPADHVCDPAKDNGAPHTCSELTDGIYTKSAAQTATVDNCYLITTAGKYVATAGMGMVDCATGGYCAGGVKIMRVGTGGREVCPNGYALSDSGAESAQQCYTDCAMATNAQEMFGRDYYANGADTCEITLCRPGYTLSAGVCAVCPVDNICTPDIERGKPQLCSDLTKGTHKFALAGSEKISDCYLKCEAYDIEYGTAVPVSATENYPVQCRFDGLSVTKNPCDIVNGTCVERSCNYNYEMIGGKCQACARENALSYKKDGGNCVVESCVSGFHPNGQACEVDTMECSVPNAVVATRVWDASKQAFGECVITECEEGYHLGANTCQADEQVCELEHGIGIREWNHKKNTWGDCIATKCDPGYTNDRSQTNELWKQCGRCNNMYSAGGEFAASSYVDGCEIATCMYEGELYTLENNECVLICDTYSDETGSRRWNASRKKCERTCEPGYMSW